MPGAYYLVRMLDGRIDIQGEIEDLRQQGVLGTIAKDAAAEEAIIARDRPIDTPPSTEQDDTEESNNKADKRPRQLVKDEARETGGVKWRIYKTYIKASSYYTWIALIGGIVLYQLLGVAEKLWIKQWGEVGNEICLASIHCTYSLHLGL